MNILLSGSLGFMGREVVKLSRAGCRGMVVTAGVDPGVCTDESIPTYKSFDEVESPESFDCIIDFSHHSATPKLLEFAVRNSLPVVLATTGQTEDELLSLKEAEKKIPIFHSANMSLGVALLTELAKKAASAMPDAEIEIIEKHHDRKIDAPSGTALMIANEICSVRPRAYTNCGRSGRKKRTEDEIGIHAVRLGNIVGEHEVIIGTQNQTITLKHEAHSRALFAEGAFSAAEFIVGCPAGIYDMKSIISGEKRADALII